MAKGVKILERKFSDIEKQLSGFIAFVDTFVEDDKEVLSFKLSQFDRLNAKYESVKEEIFTLSDVEFKNFDGKITTCNEHIEKLEVRLKSLNLKYSKNNNETGSNAVSNVIKPCFRLPELSLPQFNGDIETWFIFKEQFKEIIENCGLNDKQKLQYLQSCLIGIAKHVQTVDDTYDSLFLALEQRFENKRLIINKHINALLMLKYKKIRGDSNVDLRNLVDTSTKHLRALKLLNIEQITFSELLLIQLVMQVLDTETKRLFEMTLESTNIPKWDDFLAFLNKRCLFLENLPFAGTKVPLRVLADSGSQVSLLRSSTADLLNLRKLKTDMSVSGLGGSNVNIKSKIRGVISNGSGSYKRVVDFHVVPKITNMIPVNSFDISHIVFPSNVHLADPTFNTSNSIDDLLSADIFFDILKDGKYKLDNGNLISQNIEFGSIISGNTSRFSSGSLHCGLITKDFKTLNDTLKSFWEIEEIVPTKFVSDELKKCDEHFLKTMARDTNERFCVEMPMKDNDIELGRSKSTAIRRLELLKDVPTENKEFLFNENDELVKTLGLSLRPREDTFMHQMNLQEVPVTITKRTVLSFISKLYYPLGLLQPIIIKAKMMIQKIWLLKIDWDQNLPRQEIENFQIYVAELHQLKDLKIPRCILLKDSVAVQLIGFADVSAQVYGACLYVKSENANETQIRLLCSKTRIAPLKTFSIPRLELLALRHCCRN
ncbi:integrase catalytic domain-containing protein [Trichonephila clavata]|uniref:Integrase catalytic domain-containing protein n=1 Tax=Trichonephila clavata TaxID=2740835 RepID=A0A8X6LR46_TRICU|nr:integrase catalytic domain-containing protein [Trichonephila clavata]